MTVQTESTRNPKSTATKGAKGSTTRSTATKAAAAKSAASVKASVATPEAPVRTRKAAPARSRTAAAQRAYARRAHREGRRIEHPVEDDLDRGTGRAPFAVLIIVVLTVGIAATLWLSTQAIADSYRLEQVKQEADRLAERAAELQREVTESESAASLAERAKAMGMVPAGDPARLIVQPDGTVVLVGEPTPVQPPAPPATPTGDQAGTDQTGTGQAGNGQAGTGQTGNGQPAGGQTGNGQAGGTGQGAG